MAKSNRYVAPSYDYSGAQIQHRPRWNQHGVPVRNFVPQHRTVMQVVAPEQIASVQQFPGLLAGDWPFYNAGHAPVLGTQPLQAFLPDRTQAVLPPGWRSEVLSVLLRT